MSVFAVEMTNLRKSRAYLEKEGLLGYFARIGAENELKKDLMKRTGASDIVIDLGYARVTANSPMLDTRYFSDVIRKAISNEGRVKVKDLYNGFELRNIFGRSELVRVNGNDKKTKMEYSLSCAEGECYRDIVDTIAERIGLANASSDIGV